MRIHVIICSGSAAALFLIMGCKHKYQKMTSPKLRPREATFFEETDLKSWSKLARVNEFVIPKFVFENLESIRTFPVRETDVFVVSFPKSGTTLVQNIVLKLCLSASESQKTTRTSDHKYEQLQSRRNLEHSFPYLEFFYPGLDHIKKLKGPRLIKSHLPLCLLPKDILKAKVIYIYRNPRDVIVSYYYFHRMINEISYRGSFNQFFEKFCNCQVIASPWWKHLDGFFQIQHPNLLVISYEDLVQNAEKEIERISLFFFKRVLPNSRIRSISHETRFDQMKNDPEVNYSWWDELGIRNKSENNFLRKGKIGDWQDHFSPEMIKKLDNIVAHELPSTEFQYYEK